MEIRRELYEVLKQHLSAKEITLLVGARQVGKTTLLRALMEALRRQGEKVLFFNLDIEADARYFQSQATLLQKINLEWGDAGGYVFIDEIQRKENAGLFLKGLYDMQLPYKWVVTGSGSLELKEKIHESLVGRKRQYELFPVSFREFLHYKTENTGILNASRRFLALNLSLLQRFTYGNTMNLWRLSTGGDRSYSFGKSHVTPGNL